jgi:hypothetical protein
MRTNPVRLALASLLLVLPALGGCFLPGGTAPDGCDLEPNDSIVTSRPLAFETGAASCNNQGGAGDVDVWRLPHTTGAGGIAVDCSLVSGTGTTVAVDFVPDGSLTPNTILADTACTDGLVTSAQASTGTPYLRVVHPGSLSVRVQVEAAFVAL